MAPIKTRFNQSLAEASHRTLALDGWPDFVFAFQDEEEIGPRMFTRIAKKTGLTAADL